MTGRIKMINKSVINRPLKFGERDRREFIVQDSEVAFIAINNSDGSPIFIGRAKVGVQEKENKWQIRKIVYDKNGGVSKVEWPQNDFGNASAEYEFSWSSTSELLITDISQSNPAVVTVANIGKLQNGHRIILQGIKGLDKLNFDGSNIYTVKEITNNSFQLEEVDTSSLKSYASGGTVNFGEAINYTYS